MITYFKDFLASTWIEIKIDKKFFYLIALGYFLLWMKRHYETQGAIQMYQYLQQQAEPTASSRPQEGEPDKMGSHWDPNI